MAVTHEGWVRGYAALVDRHRDHLNELDAAIGDADHGANMHRGLVAAIAAVQSDPPASDAELFRTVGATFVSTVGGASGPLFGALFARMGSSLDEHDQDHRDGVAGTAFVPPVRLAVALRAGLCGVVARGRAEPGDKTMYDALAPAVEAFAAAVARGAALDPALRAAASAATAGRDATVPMTARKGRASYLGARSVGHQDPGAASVALFFQAATRPPDPTGSSPTTGPTTTTGENS